MAIVDEDVARVRETTDVAAVIGEQVALKRVGGRLVGLCPFHNEKTPSFSVNQTEGLFYCFGCQARGDIITFVRETQHLDFVGAVEYLAGRAGIQLRYDSNAATREHHRKSELTEAMEAAVEWYHQRLLTAADAGGARRYLRNERGYDAAVVREFRLGWAPAGWDELTKALPFSADVLRDVGLSMRNKADKEMDVFRARLMFPIFDAGGRPVGMGARILPGADGPKYKNSQEGPLYSKRKVLYGLNWAKADVVASGEVIVCEGYTDVIAFHRAGIPRAVATCGTALAEEHMALLKNFARRIILAYDDDAAGHGAAEKFYAWEQKLELDIHVMQLPPGADPGSTDAATLAAEVGKARPFLDFWVERILEAADMQSAEGRARAAERALTAIAAHPNDLVRDQYVMQLADRCRVPADRLRSRLEDARRAPQPTEQRRAPEPRPNVEVEALRLAIHRPEEVASLLEEVLFEDAVNRTAFRALLATSTLQEAIEEAGPDAEALLHRLAVEEPDPAIEAEDIVAVLVRAAAGRAIAHLEAETRATGELVNLTWAKQRMELLMESDRRVEAATELVTWLVGGGQEGT
ncbi:MAG: DNA primase [Acidimicrobiales bacterium]